ncbi:MAG: hypothetical protein U0271_37960 [Polyangiaceae bacterium]
MSEIGNDGAEPTSKHPSSRSTQKGEDPTASSARRGARHDAVAQDDATAGATEVSSGAERILPKPGAVPAAQARSLRPRANWIWVALPVGGLMILPVVGLVYAATGSFGKDAAGASASGSAALLDEDDPAGALGAAKGKKTAKKSPTSKTSAGRLGHPRSDEAAECCAKLHELGRTLPVDERSIYLSAAASCDSAPDAELAFRRVRSQLGVAMSDVPAECAAADQPVNPSPQSDRRPASVRPRTVVEPGVVPPEAPPPPPEAPENPSPEQPAAPRE